MGFKKKLSSALAVAVFGVAAATGASAAVVQSCAVNSGLACLVNANEFGTNNSGNDFESSVEQALAAALNVSSIDLTLLGKSDSGYGSAVSGQSGSWTTPDAVSYFTVKAANSYIIFDGSGLTSGSWSTMGILNNGGQQPGVSHISYWSVPSAVPLPAAAWMLLAGVGGLAVMKRRKKA